MDLDVADTAFYCIKFNVNSNLENERCHVLALSRNKFRRTQLRAITRITPGREPCLTIIPIDHIPYRSISRYCIYFFTGPISGIQAQ